MMEKENYEVKIVSNDYDLRQLLFFAVLAVITQVFLLFDLSWNIIAVIGCIIISVFLLIIGGADWLYFNRTVILDAQGCTFTSFFATKKFSWESIYLLRTENSSFLFGDSEIPGEGVILSINPISKPLRIGAMTYCRFTHPSTSVFIRLVTSMDQSKIDRLKNTSAKLIYTGFVADKEEILCLLQHKEK